MGQKWVILGYIDPSNATFDPFLGVPIEIPAGGPYGATGTLPKRGQKRAFLTPFWGIWAKWAHLAHIPPKRVKKGHFGPIWPQLATIAQ